MASQSAADPNGVLSVPGENEYPSGFPRHICDEAPREKYLCSNCANVLNKAHQTICGHRYCLACVNWLVRNNKNLVCAKCKEEDASGESEISILTLESFFNDAAINKEILELRVHCANQGCPWKSTLKDLEDHQSQCEHALIPCHLGCGHMVQRKALASHVAKGCSNNKGACPTCPQALPPLELQKHICASPSEKKPVKAEKRQKNSPEKKELCVFSEVGCPFKGSSERVREHERHSLEDHLHLLLDISLGLRLSVSSSSERRFEQDVEVLQGLPIYQRQEDRVIETDGGDGGASERVSLARSLRDDQVGIQMGQQLEELQQKVLILENIISVLNREVEKTQLGMVAVEKESQNNLHIIKGLEAKVTGLQQRLARRDMCIASLQQAVAVQKEISYDGIFLWRICDLRQKLHDAVTGQMMSQYSPAFYTARYGYKVCMRLYLNGDGMGKGTHISLFFVIMRGEYDALLPWPFKHKVTFFLIDQNHREHVIDAFRPDLSSVSFHRPVSEMSVASGCPLFFQLDKLRSPKHAYCRDDTLFVKCVVDTSS